MKVKRYKHAKKVLLFYKNSFAFREPYQVIVDGTFCQAALEGRIYIKEQLPKYFSGSVQLVTTGCIVHEVRSLGEDLLGAALVAKRFSQRSCGHKKSPVDASSCILSMIGEKNENHFIVATQDAELQSKLRDIPGTPIVRINKNTLVLEGPSDASRRKSEEMAQQSTQLTEFEQTVVSALDSTLPVQAGKGKKRKQPHGPNPLSVKKKRKKSCTVVVNSKGMLTKNQKRRERLKRSKALAALGKLSTSSNLP